MFGVVDDVEKKEKYIENTREVIYCKKCYRNIYKKNWEKHLAGEAHNKTKIPRTDLIHCNICRTYIVPNTCTLNNWDKHLAGEKHKNNEIKNKQKQQKSEKCYCKDCDKELRLSNKTRHSNSKGHK
jgi:hypothetical protein